MRHRAAILALAILIVGGCREEAPPAETQEINPVLLVTAAPAMIAAIHTSLRALGVTVALHHVTIRSPATGRVVGINLKNGDIVRRGQVIGYVVNREIEAAQAGLEIARELDPQSAAALEQSVSRYDK